MIEVRRHGVAVVSRASDGRETVLGEAGSDRAEDVISLVRSTTPAGRNRLGIVVGFADDVVVEQRVSLPHGPLSVLHRAAGLQADFDQPFPDGQGVAFWAIDRTAPTGADVRLAFAQAEPARSIVAALSADGLAPVAIEVRCASPFRAEGAGAAQLIRSPGIRFAATPVVRSALAALGLVVLSLGVNIGWTSWCLWQSSGSAAAIGSDIEQFRREEAALRFIAARQREALARLGALDILAKTLPDGHWLAEAEIKGDRIEFGGHAPSAAEALRLVAATRAFTALESISAVSRDDKGNRERFRLGGQIALPSPAQSSAGRSP